MNKLQSYLLVTLGLFLFQGMQAQPPSDRGQRGDRGQRPSPEQIFNKMDTNQDGKVSFSEFENMRAPRRGGQNINKQEIFNQIDSNNNGYLSQQEFENFRSQRGGNRGEMGEEGAQKKGKKKGKKKKKMMKKLKNADTNGDQKISYEEFSAIEFEGEVDKRSLFDRLDSNDDGYLEKREIKSKGKVKAKGSKIKEN